MPLVGLVVRRLIFRYEFRRFGPGDAWSVRYRTLLQVNDLPWRGSVVFAHKRKRGRTGYLSRPARVAVLSDPSQSGQRSAANQKVIGWLGPPVPSDCDVLDTLWLANSASLPSLPGVAVPMLMY